MNFPERESEVLKFWDEKGIFKKTLEKPSPKGSFVFYDGPPFATGLPHYGHLLASIIKDVIPRFWTMKGYRVERRWGWDCHGIPIENMIEKELDLKGGKKGIEEFGIDKFNAACRAAILRFDKEWERTIRRIARWVDFKNSYKTMDNSFMESVWWAFKTLHDKGLVYEGRRVILYCPRCATPLSNFEIAMDNSYKDLTGPSTVYKFKVKGASDTYLLAWSTTPWNKLATPALAVHPTFSYVKVEQGDEYYILAKSALKMLNKSPTYTILEEYPGKDLEKLEFELHYDFYPDRKQGERAGVVIADEYVTADDGTGIVTLAVYGENDYRVMTTHNVQLVEHVDTEGKLKPEVTPWAGMFINKVNPLVNEDLQKRGLIYRDEERQHSVPVCYRCETRLYQTPIPAWFINVQKLKPELIVQNEHINWYPEHLKHGRFGKGLETAPDWNISRSRYWGTPMPVWVGEKGTVRVLGSYAEMKEWAIDPSQVEALTDCHREFLDPIELWVDDARTEKGKRIPEVFDCWMESGSMPYAAIHAPFENQKQFTQSFPAQFVTEYIAQTRAWFYVMHVLSVGLFGSHAVENILTTGTILAQDGTKMSKSKKNYPDPALVIEKYGADAVRYYLMSTPIVNGENLNFSEAGVSEVSKKFINILTNVFAYYALYAEQGTQVKQQVEHVLDRWILARLHETLKEETQALEVYDLQTAARALQGFVTDLSTWYVRRSRERMKTEGSDREQALSTLRLILETFAKMCAPFTPFLAEMVFTDLGHTTSVHMEDWPVVDSSLIDEKVLEEMGRTRSIVSKALERRADAGINVRQALRGMTVTIPTGEFAVEYQELAKDEVNVKSVELKKGDYAVELDLTLTPELVREGTVREIIRRVNDLRKQSGLTIEDRIELFVTGPKDVMLAVKEHEATLLQGTLAESVRTQGDVPANLSEFKANEFQITIGF